MFGLVAYSYISPKSLPTGTTSKKLIDPRVKYVFLGFSNETTKQYCVYRPDLGYIVMLSVVDVDEERQGGLLDLKIRRLNAQGNSASMFISGTQSHLLLRKLVGRPKKEEAILIVESLLSKLNNFDIVIPIPRECEDASTDFSSRARLNKTRAGSSPKSEDISTDSSSRARLNKTEVGSLPKIDKPNIKRNNRTSTKSNNKPNNKPNSKTNTEPNNEEALYALYPE